MAFVKFKGYGRGEPKFINTDRVIHFSQVDYNGNYGTEFKMDDGSAVTVGEWPDDVAKKIAAAEAEEMPEPAAKPTKIPARPARQKTVKVGG